MRGRVRWIAPALIGAVAVAAAGGQIAPAAGPPRTLDLVAAGQRCSHVDVGRKGGSVGDEMFCRATLRAATGGAAAGSVRYTCAYLGSERAGDECTALARLAGGTLLLAGALSHTNTVSEWAVVGGTGTYVGARGSARLRQLGSTRTAVTISLLGEA
jgi:dirigent-like protein